MTRRYTCPKCEGTHYNVGEVRATGGFWTKVFNIQNRKFTTVSCNNCGYTEFYQKQNAGTGENILDFLTN